MPHPGFGATGEPEASKGLPMLGYLLISAIVSGIVFLIGLGIFVRASVKIALHDPENAADIIKAMGGSFPFQRGWLFRWPK